MITYLLPAFNEEDNLKRVESELLPVAKRIDKKYEVIIIDDGSTDNSLDIARKLEKKHKEIRVVKHKVNKGLGQAVRTGITNSRGDLIITLDSDFTFHPNEIPKLVKAYKKTKVDCVIGSHFLKGGKLENVPKYRIFLSKSVNMIYQILMGKNINSVSSIFRLYESKTLKNLELTSKGFDINAEILFKLIQQKKKIMEVPSTLTTRIHGTSKINTIKEIKNHLKLFTKIIKWKIKA